MSHQPQPESGSSTPPPLNCVICVMGVSGCGKSTVAELIATRFGVPFCEADSLHPAANIEKMAAGIPLDDEDREPWLRAVRDETTRLASASGKPSGNGCVVACSALKESYRKILEQAHARVIFVHLVGSFELIHARMASRGGHFMPASLLRSQFEALQPPAPGPSVIQLTIDASPESLAREAARVISENMIISSQQNTPGE